MRVKARATYSVIGLAVTIDGWSVNLETMDKHATSDASPTPRLTNAFLITGNVNQLIQFYEPPLGFRRSGPVMITPNFIPARGRSRFSQRPPKRSTFQARPKLRKTKAQY